MHNCTVPEQFQTFGDLAAIAAAGEGMVHQFTATYFHSPKLQ